MTAATIEINDQDIIAALNCLAFSTQHLKPALDAIGTKIAASIMLNFTGQHDPDGNSWESLSDATLLNRTSGAGQKGIALKVLQGNDFDFYGFADFLRENCVKVIVF